MDTQLIAIEPGNRIQLPGDWAEALGMHGVVRLDKTQEGILIRPAPSSSWDEIFAHKLPIGRHPPQRDDLQVTKDDLLF